MQRLLNCRLTAYSTFIPFIPGMSGTLLPEYLTACREKGILDVRIIHGKGTGMLRETVHALLKRLPEVVSFRLAGQDAGSWGATVVRLAPLDHAQREGGKQ